MKTILAFALALVQLASARPVLAQVPGCVNGVLADAKGYVLSTLGVHEGAPAADWENVLKRSGIPSTSSVAGTIAGAEWFGITQWKGSAGNVRGRLSLPTAVPDALGYLTRSVDVIADNPTWAVPCWQDSRACLWTWREDAGSPPYAPRSCGGGAPTPIPNPQPPPVTPPTGELAALTARLAALEERHASLRSDFDAFKAPQPVPIEDVLKALEAMRFECVVARTGPGFLSHGHGCTVTPIPVRK